MHQFEKLLQSDYHTALVLLLKDKCGHGHRQMAALGRTSLAFVGALLFVGSTGGATIFDTVALTGQPAPGTEIGTVFGGLGFGDPALNNAGQVVFSATLMGGGVTTANETGLWAGAPEGLALLAREGGPAPGESVGVNYAGFSQPSLNVGGRSAFNGFTTAARFAIWTGPPGSISALVREGDQAAGTPPGTNHSGLNNPALNSAGQSAFYGSLTGAGVTNSNNFGLWSGAQGNLALVARSGSEAPGTATGVYYAGFFGDPTLNAAGQSAFSASLTGFQVTTANDAGVWIGAPGSVMLLARKGTQAPGAGLTFGGFGNVRLNGAGQSAFFATLSAGAAASDSGLWVGTPGNLALLVREGDPAPGTVPGVTFGPPGTPRLNATGQSLFSAALVGSGVTTANDSGIWIGNPGALTKVIREGEGAPGLAAGTFFGLTVATAINDRSEVVFHNMLAGPNVNPTRDGSLWFADGTGVLTLIVREGNAFEVAPGDTRVVQSLAFEGGAGDEDGLPSGLNDLGQITFRASFTDGSHGIFIATVPEPAMSALLTFIAAVFAGMRRRSKSALPQERFI